MSNTVTNILTINGTEEQVAEVRNFIKGSNGESISLQSIIPMPKKLRGKKMIEIKGLSISPDEEPITIPDWMDWRLKNWGPKWDAEPVQDEDDDAPNRIIFYTADVSPLHAMTFLSKRFPALTFHVIFSDEYEDSYCGEYTLTGGEAANVVWYDAWVPEHNNLPIDQVMEYYFLTHEFDRAMWKKDDDGSWYRIKDEQDEE